MWTAIKYLIYYKHRWSKASMLGPSSFDEYVNLLGLNNVTILENSICKKIQWECPGSFYIFRFSPTGDFQLVEREVWIEYIFPSFKKVVILDIDRSHFLTNG